MVAQAFNPRSQEAEASRSLRVWGQPNLQNEFQYSQGYYTERPCLGKKNQDWTKPGTLVNADLECLYQHFVQLLFQRAQSSKQEQRNSENIQTSCYHCHQMCSDTQGVMSEWGLFACCPWTCETALMKRGQETHRLWHSLGRWRHSSKGSKSYGQSSHSRIVWEACHMEAAESEDACFFW